MWQMYDELIAGIPPHFKVEKIVQLNHWTILSNGENIGGAMVFDDAEETPNLAEYEGANLQTVAEQVKSWNLKIASIGLAAINSYYNRLDAVENNSHFNVTSNDDIFKTFCQEDLDAKIGMIGHFHQADLHRKTHKNLHIFELNPRKGDLPASASEFLLPEMDYVYITGSTLVNKTLPRLLELSKNAHVAIVGASTTLSETLWKYGVNELAGTIQGSSFEEVLAKKKGNRLVLAECGIPIILKEKREW